MTGDRAFQDTDGYFYFVGRSDDVIKSSGYSNIIDFLICLSLQFPFLVSLLIYLW